MRRIEITELFLVKPNWERTYVGVIERDVYEDGSTIVHGRIPVENYVIYASASNEEILGNKLDELVTLILDHNIMEIPPPFTVNYVKKFDSLNILIFREYLN